MTEPTIKYQLTVTSIGELVGDFIDAGILVFFGEGAPDELLEFSIIHTHTDLSEPVVPGDTIYFGEEAFRVTAVGNVANENLGNLGHLVVKANGNEEPELPGDVCVEAKALPEISPGLVVKILGQ